MHENFNSAVKKVLILGGAGNFGKRIAKSLLKHGIAIVIAGRDHQKLQALSTALTSQYPSAQIATRVFDVKSGLAEQLTQCNPALVINTCGPFQGADYHIAETCISQARHYIDLADARDFVNRIGVLDASAKAKNVAVIAGASTVPGLSSAVIEYFQHEFSILEHVQYGISPGQKAERGLATTQAILSYLGKPLTPYVGAPHQLFGWQDLYRQQYPTLGKRWMANCDIPDLDIFPERYAIKTLRFSAGMENSVVHLGMWMLSWLQRLGVPLHLASHAATLLRMSHWFDGFGSSDGGMHMQLSGKDQTGHARQITWFIIAENGDGPEIPTIPAVVLAKKIIQQQWSLTGAMPCVGLISLAEYLAELKDFAVSTHLS